jgi:WD40 repeat protein
MEGTVKLWDVQTGRKSAELRDDRLDVSIRALASSPDGKTLAVALHRSSTGDIIILWDVPTKRPRQILKKVAMVPSLAFSPDGQTLATGPVFKLWDVATGRERRTLQREGRIGTFHHLCFSPDGKLLAAGFGNEYPAHRPNGAIHVWDIATGKERLRLEDRTGIDAVAFSPDGKLLASAGRHGYRTTLWEVATGKRLALLHLPNTPAIRCYALAFAPDGKTLAMGCRNRLGNAPADELVGVVLWEVNTRQPRAVLKGDGDIVRSLTFAPDGNSLAAGRGTGMVSVWQIAPPRPAK